MSTVIRADISAKNPYWISRHRYYELKHFCLQYPEWKRELSNLSGIKNQAVIASTHFDSGTFSNPTADCAEKIMFLKDRIDMIERTARNTAPDLAKYILKGATEGLSYTYLKSKLEIPCCKDKYYELYRKFFWLLSNARH